MPNVDNLNFAVILDDKQFNQKIKAMEDLAKKSNTNMSNILNIQIVSQEMVSSNRKRLQMETDIVRATERQNREKIKTEGLQRKINAQVERATKGYQSQSRILNELKGYALGYLSVHGASQLLSSLVRVTGEFELQKTTLAAMLGDLNQAEHIITRIQGLAVESPFKFKELTTYAKQLSAFSVPTEELYETTKTLADVSAGLGVDMNRIVLAYGQVFSAAFLRGQEVRQFTEAGIPILDELAKQFEELEGRAVSTGEVFDKISARLVPFEMVAKVFKDMTSEGGKFYNMQEVQAETLRGKLSNLKDAYEVMLNEIGSAHSDKLKGAVDLVRRLMQNYEETGRTIIELIATYGLYKTALITCEVLSGKLALRNVALIKQFRQLRVALYKNPYVALAAGATVAIAAIYKIGKEMKSQTAIAETLGRAQNKYAADVEQSTVALDALYAKINLAKKGTKDYNTALSTIQRTYAPYIEQLKAEGVEVDNLATLYSELTKKIKESAQARFVENARKDLDQTYAQGLSDILNGTGSNAIYNLKRAMEALNLNEAEGVVLRMFLSGNATWDEISAQYTELAEKVENAYVSLGAGSSGPMKAKEYLDILKGSLTNLTNEYTTAIAIVDEFAIKLKESPTNTKPAEGWRKTVQDTLSGMGLDKGTSFGLWAEDTTQSTDYVEDMIKRYKELNEQIKLVSPFDEEQTERLNKNKDAIEAIAKALNIDIKNLAANDSDTWESKEEKRLKSLIATLRKLQDQYDELKSLGVSDDAIKSLFQGWYPELGKDFFNNMDFLTRAKVEVENLRKLSPESADKALVDLGGDKYTQYVDKLKEQQKAYKESAKAAGEYFNTLRKWATEDFNLNGEGIVLDVSKIASDLSEKMNEIDLRARKAKEIFEQIDVDSEEEVAKVREIFVKEFGEDAWEEFWQSYETEGTKAIDNLVDKQKIAERKIAQERVNDLAKKYVKESYFTNSIELTDLGDKNFFQLRELRKKLQDLLSKDPLKVPVGLQTNLEEVGVDVGDLTGIDLDALSEQMGGIKDADLELLKLIQSIQNAGLSTEEFGKVVNKVFEGDLENVTKELKESFLELGKLAVSQIRNILSALGDLADASGDRDLKETVGFLQDSADVISSAVQGFATGGWIGAIIGGIGTLAEKLINVAAEAERVRQEMKEMEYEFKEFMEEFERTNLLESFSGMFGSAEFNRYLASVGEAKKSLSEISDVLLDVAKNQREWENVVRAIAEGNYYLPVLNQQYSDDPNIVFDKRNWWERNFWGGEDKVKTFDLNTLFENNKPVAEKFEELRLLYEQMGDTLESKDKETVKALLDNWTEYVEAQKQNAEYLKSLFGDLASNIADSMINSFLEVGDAAAGLDGVFDNLAQSLAKSLLKDFLFTNVLNKYKTNIEMALNESEGFSDEDFWQSFKSEIEKMKLEVESIAPHVNDILSSLGLDSESFQTLGDGIKGITEDTANLLASYLNAIRADVSYARTIWERMDVTTQQIATLLAGFSAPSLMEYQVQIAANTYNTAIHTQEILSSTQEILSKLDSVLVYDGPTAIRIYS